MIVFVPLLLIGLGVWIYRSVDNRLNYTLVDAEVQDVEDICAPVGAPTTGAVPCANADSAFPGKTMAYYHSVTIRYTSPADQREHSGVIIPRGGEAGVEASRLRRGDRWSILARNDQPDDIKAHD